MNDDGNSQVAEAIRRIVVPDHGAGFWERLDGRLAEVGATAAPADDAAAGAEIVPLHPFTGPDRGRRARLLAVAAVFLLVGVSAAVLVLERGGDVRPVDVASEGSGGTRAPDGDGYPGRTSPTATPDPGAVALAFVDAIGAGNVQTAADLLGGRSRRYIEAIGGEVDGFLLEAQEGYGAWADSPDRSTSEFDLGETASGETVVVVVIAGTWTGEGETGHRTDALPVVQAPNGSWLVEPFAYDPMTGGRLEILSPTADEAGRGGLAPDGAVEASAPGGGTFHFAIDGGRMEQVDGEVAGSGVRARWDPPGRLESRSHLLVVAYVDDATVTAFAGVFAVEG